MADAPLCRVLYANQLVIDQRWSWRLSDPFWRLYFNRDAGARIAAEHGTWDLPPYRAVVVPPWGDLRGSCTTPVRHFYVHFETPGLDLAQQTGGPVILAEEPILRAMLDELAAGTRAVYPNDADYRWRIPDRADAPRGARWRLRVQSATERALALALDVLDHADTAATTGGDLEPALAWIEDHLAEPLSVAALAKRCRLSGDHFGKRFATATGRTPMRYVQERRVAAAADRLLGSDEAIDAIARRCGFANRFHFSRVFRDLIGTPPAQYRRQHR